MVIENKQVFTIELENNFTTHFQSSSYMKQVRS